MSRHLVVATFAVCYTRGIGGAVRRHFGPSGERLRGDRRTAQLGFAPSENPFVVEHGGFYRRWLSMIDDLGELEKAVSGLTGTTQDHWIPGWRELGRRHEEAGDRLEASGAYPQPRQSFLQAKTYYSIGRFPGEITDLKAEISRECARA